MFTAPNWHTLGIMVITQFNHIIPFFWIKRQFYRGKVNKISSTACWLLKLFVTFTLFMYEFVKIVYVPKTLQQPAAVAWPINTSSAAYFVLSRAKNSSFWQNLTKRLLWLKSILCNHNSGQTFQNTQENIHDWKVIALPLKSIGIIQKLTPFCGTWLFTTICPIWKMVSTIVIAT